MVSRCYEVSEISADTGSISVCCRESSRRVCPSDSFLQLRIIRISVDRVNAIIWDENTNVLVEGETFRLRICNWKTLHVGFALKNISARLLMNIIGDKCIDTANFTLNDTDLLIKVINFLIRIGGVYCKKGRCPLRG